MCLKRVYTKAEFEELAGVSIPRRGTITCWKVLNEDTRQPTCFSGPSYHKGIRVTRDIKHQCSKTIWESDSNTRYPNGIHLFLNKQAALDWSLEKEDVVIPVEVSVRSILAYGVDGSQGSGCALVVKSCVPLK